MRRHAGEDGRPRGIAGRRGTVGIGKQQARGGQAIKIGGPRLGVSAQATDPVIEVVHGNEQHVRWRSLQLAREEKN